MKKERGTGKWAAPPKWKEVPNIQHGIKVEIENPTHNPRYELVWSSDNTWEDDSFLWWNKEFNWLNGLEKLNKQVPEQWIAWNKPPPWKSF